MPPTEQLWEARSSQWGQEEEQILTAMQGLQQIKPERILDGIRALRFLELVDLPNRGRESDLGSAAHPWLAAHAGL